MEHYKGVISDIQSLSLNITSIENYINEGSSLDYDDKFNNFKERVTFLMQVYPIYPFITYAFNLFHNLLKMHTDSKFDYEFIQ